MIFFFTHPPLPDFWKKSSGEACYARGGEKMSFSGANKPLLATRGARSVKSIHCSLKCSSNGDHLSTTLRGIWTGDKLQDVCKNKVNYNIWHKHADCLDRKSTYRK